MTDVQIMPQRHVSPQLNHESDPKIFKSLELWELGFSKEQQGSMTDAIKYYRQALRLNPDVESTYRKKVQHEIKVNRELQELKVRENQELVKKLQSIDKNDSKENTPDEEKVVLEPCLLFEMLPSELLMSICEQVMCMSGESWVNLSLTCSFLNTLSFSENSRIFKRLARKIYPYQSYDLTLFRRLSPVETKNINELQLESYSYDYRKMLRERPFMKFEGIYISVNNYLRHGSIPEGSSSLLNPIHMITYYRYFRFFSNGTVLRFVTSEEPQAIVKKFNENLKDIQTCKWSINVEDPSLLTIERHSAKYTYIEQFQIANQNKFKRHNKLKWIESYFLDKDGEKIVYNLKNEKPFVFSRVRSYADASSSGDITKEHL
ncbi:hypothetical protein ACO0QE_002764 [Hanseniaspora vineae]